MGKRNLKNLSPQDLEDVSTYVEEIAEKRHGSYGIRLQDIQIKIKCLNEKQKDLKNAIEQKDVVISTGPAGTGKTYLSLMTALHLMKTQPVYTRLILIKSLQTIKGEEVGYLPGSLWEKMEPYVYSFTGNLDKILGYGLTTKALIDKGIIQIMPIAYIRGVTIDNAIVIIDEIQNLSIHAFRTIITRIGHNCKMVFLGDSDQIDLKNINDSCINKILKTFRDTEIVKVVEFNEEETVRNPLIKNILNLMKDI